MRLVVVAALSLLTIGLIAGCGDSDSGPTKEEFLTKANAICKKYDGDIQKQAEARFKEEPNKQQLEQFATEVAIPDVTKEVAEIRALDKPSADEDQINEVLDSAEAATAELKADPALITEEGDKDPFAEASAKAGAVGMKECAN